MDARGEHGSVSEVAEEQLAGRGKGGGALAAVHGVGYVYEMRGKGLQLGNAPSRV